MRYMVKACLGCLPRRWAVAVLAACCLLTRKKKESKEEKCESCKKADEILLEIFTFKVVPHRLVSSLDVLL